MSKQTLVGAFDDKGSREPSARGSQVQSQAMERFWDDHMRATELAGYTVPAKRGLVQKSLSIQRAGRRYKSAEPRSSDMDFREGAGLAPGATGAGAACE